MNVVDEYLLKFETKKVDEINRLRKIVINMLPGCQEKIYYNMPTIFYKSKPIIVFDARKNHIGVYPYSGSVIPLVDELSGFQTSKGAIRETFDNLLKEETVKKIVLAKLGLIGLSID